ncbi:MAG TPA: TlpA disulfide reductase family protein, partial [Candidatus Competibacteraceae bacterium]|nr:TlpA disulfide reductase family protein [Candidatus Competibacteraceae bacterium]
MSTPVFRMNTGRAGLRLAWILTLLLASLSASAQPLNFTLPGLNGQAVQLADFRGRWVVVNFWASWCTPCLMEMPELQTFHEQHADRAT